MTIERMMMRVSIAAIAAVTGAAIAASATKAASRVSFLARISVVVAIAVTPWDLGCVAQAWMLTPSYRDLTPLHRLGSDTDIHRNSVMRFPSSHKSSAMGRGDVSTAGSQLLLSLLSSSNNNENEFSSHDETTGSKSDRNNGEDSRPTPAFNADKEMPLDRSGSVRSDGDVGGANEPPPLKENDNPLDFFSSLVPKSFWAGEESRKIVEAVLKRRFKNIATVRDALLDFPSEDVAVDFFADIGIQESRIRECFKMLQSVEDYLDALGIITLNGGNEISVLRNRYVELDFREDLLRDVRNATQTRSLPVCMVLGSSGSGKTFFAVQDAATAGVVGRRKVTVYLVTNLSSPKFLEEFRKPEDLVDAIKKNLTSYGYSKQLDMHVSIVIDEVGSPGLNGYFEDRTKLSKICSALEELAISTRLIVAGTGLEASDLSSRDDVYKIRMRPWTSTELTTVLTRRLGMADSNPELAVDAILQQPILKALSTNARSAYFLLQSVADSFASKQTPILWVNAIRELSPSLVDFVVREYIKNNGLSALRGNRRADRYRVAGSVFLAIEAGRNSTEAPTFPELTSELRSYANSLIDLDVERVNNKMRYISEDGELAVLVSPAIVIILYDLLGVQAAQLTNWDAQQLITGLEVFRHEAMKLYRAFIDVSYSTQAQDTYVKDMQKVQLVRLFQPVPPTNTKNMVKVPRVENGVIWINGNLAPFADVVARYALYLCKHRAVTENDTADQVVTINLRKELGKCGLLTSANDSPGQAVLRALLQNWNGDYDDETAQARNVDGWSRIPDRKSPLSAEGAKKKYDLDQKRRLYAKDRLKAKRRLKAFPTNLLDAPYSFDGVIYDQIKRKSGEPWIVNKMVELGDLDIREKLRFVISTNSENIRLTFGEGKATIKLAVEDGKVNLAKSVVGEIDLNELEDQDLYLDESEEVNLDELIVEPEEERVALDLQQDLKANLDEVKEAKVEPDKQKEEMATAAELYQELIGELVSTKVEIEFLIT